MQGSNGFTSAVGGDQHSHIEGNDEIDNYEYDRESYHYGDDDEEELMVIENGVGREN